MKIDINRIPLQGLTLEEEIIAAALDLDTQMAKFQEPIRVKAEVSKITNVVSINMILNGAMSLNCSRCLSEFKIDLKKNLKLNYPINKLEPIIDLNQDIKEEIILGYPIKPLCKADCKGLCPKCGKNLNEGDCSCAIT